MCANTPTMAIFKPPSWHHWPWSWEGLCAFCSHEAVLPNSSNRWSQCKYRIFVMFLFSPKQSSASPLQKFQIIKDGKQKQCGCSQSQKEEPISEDQFYKGAPFWSGDWLSPPGNSLYLSPVMQPPWHRHQLLMPQHDLIIPSCWGWGGRQYCCRAG